ncbi:hypothetical protein [Sphingomonas cavernae]|uniref:Uncharacterized protein n=1 Tax=Sphingomonas cavernae TaxID=2320861 RepID=A0A418WQH2_9SPHN|nr:hypothetical protein [Sphingomonas cavernae]RJF93494.1 hypothetical protein D3876_04010 [Sphingomonas cavernae]
MTDKPEATKIPRYSLLAGSVILLVFALLVWIMMTQGMQLEENQQYRWDRLLLIFNAVETMAVAAAGVLLGTTVQQGRVAAAEARAADAQTDAKSASVTAAKATSKLEAARRISEGVDPPGAGRDNAEIIAAINNLKAVLSD